MGSLVELEGADHVVESGGLTGRLELLSGSLSGRPRSDSLMIGRPGCRSFGMNVPAAASPPRTGTSRVFSTGP